jgi:hypothetical protein
LWYYFLVVLQKKKDKNSMKTNQLGFAHIGLIAVIFVVFGVVGFAAFRVGQHTSQNKETQTASTPEPASPIKLIEEEKPVVEVTIPAEEKLIEKVAEPVTEKPAPAPKPVEQTPKTKKEDKVWLEMTKVQDIQQGSVVLAQSTLPQAMSGTCNFKLWQDGYEKVFSSNQITNSKDCTGQLDISSLPTYTGWSLHVWFDASDGKTHAYQKESPISLTQP